MLREDYFIIYMPPRSGKAIIDVQAEFWNCGLGCLVWVDGLKILISVELTGFSVSGNREFLYIVTYRIATGNQQVVF